MSDQDEEAICGTCCKEMSPDDGYCFHCRVECFPVMCPALKENPQDGAIIDKVCSHCGEELAYPHTWRECAEHTKRRFAALLGKEQDMATQDNRSTADPLFVVEDAVVVAGVSEEYGGEPVWATEDGYPVGETKARRLELVYQRTGEERDGYHRVCCVERWQFVSAFFTESAANCYVEDNRHNLRKPRVYGYSLSRNREMREIRRALMGGEL